MTKNQNKFSRNRFEFLKSDIKSIITFIIQQKYNTKKKPIKKQQMTTTDYIIITVIVIISSIYYKAKEHVNEISQILSPSKIEQNKLQVVMQPKWFLNYIWIILILWVIAFYVLISSVKWWSILYIIGCVVAIAILSFIVPPSKKSLSIFFFRVTHKRYRQRFNYTPEEEELLIKANDFLSNLTGLKN